MRRLLLRFFALFVCLTLSLGFSATVNAESVQVYGYEIDQDVYIMRTKNLNNDTGVIYEWFSEFVPHNNTEEHESYVFQDFSVSSTNSFGLQYRNVWNIKFSGSYPFELEKENRVTLDNFYFAYLINSMQYVREICENDSVYIDVKYADGTSEVIEPTVTNDKNYNIDISFNFTPKGNVKEFNVFIDSMIYPHLPASLTSSSSSRVAITAYFGEWKGDDTHSFLIEVATEEEKLLGGILGWIKNIFDKITGIGESIMQLPSKLWDTISSGLSNLFVPSDGHFELLKNKFDNLLQDKFGLLYDCKTILDGLLGSVSASATMQTDADGSIVIPEVTIPLPDDSEFTFGGQTVKIIPDNFEFLADMCKLVTSIICTFAVLNFGRNTLLKIIGAS